MRYWDILAFERIAAYDKRHRAGVVGEEDGGLAGGIARPDQIHIVSLGRPASLRAAP